MAALPKTPKTQPASDKSGLCGEMVIVSTQQNAEMYGDKQSGHNSKSVSFSPTACPYVPAIRRQCSANIP